MLQHLGAVAAGVAGDEDAADVEGGRFDGAGAGRDLQRELHSDLGKIGSFASLRMT